MDRTREIVLEDAYSRGRLPGLRLAAYDMRREVELTRLWTRPPGERPW